MKGFCSFFFFDNDEQVASRLKNLSISRLGYKKHSVFMNKMAKSAKLDALFMTKTVKKPYPLWPHIPIKPKAYQRAPPPTPRGLNFDATSNSVAHEV